MGMDKAFRETLVSIRREIHRHPELGNQEFRTTELIEKTLKSAGVTTKRLPQTGVVGVIRPEGRRRSKRCIALRGDIDALPIKEATGKPYASTRPGIMHACGHDANSTMVLGAALLLAQRRSELAGTVKCIFQPNEEFSGGALSVIDAGALKKPDVEAIVGVHVSPWLKTGTLGLKHNEMMAAVDRFSLTITGSGGHGAYPHLGTDAVVVAGQVINALQVLVSREIDPVEPVVITVGKISGGERYNILCGSVTMTGTVRTLNERLHRGLKARMEKKIRGITSAFGATYSFEYETLGHALKNSPEILELCAESGRSVFGGNRVIMLEKPSMGGEDFAEYLRYVPGCFVYVGTGGKHSYPWHHEKFDIDEDALPLGAAFLADTALRYLKADREKRC